MKLITEEVQNIQYIIEEDKNTNKKNYFIEGVFMMAERPNKNGRIYKYNTLKNEVDRYKKEYIDKNRGLGELGHPCLSGDAEILTVNDGWKHIEDCVEGELVYTMNPDSKNVEIHPIKKVVINHHEGVMLNFKSRGMRMSLNERILQTILLF